MQDAQTQTPITKSGAHWLLDALRDEGCEVLFGYPGGAIMPVYDALVDYPIKHILVRHEQGAALSADGYARVSGKVGVCMATSGPGATNLLTGIANASGPAAKFAASCIGNWNWLQAVRGRSNSYEVVTVAVRHSWRDLPC